MISINKYFALAVVASVLLSAALVQADESEEAPADKAKSIGGLGTKIIDGIKNAGTTIMSHIKPYLPGQGAKGAAAEEEAKDEKKEEAAKDGEEEQAAEGDDSANDESAPEESKEEAKEEAKEETKEEAKEEAKEESKEEAKEDAKEE